MNTKILYLITVLILILPAFSCSKIKIDEQIQADINKYDDYEDNLSRYNYQMDIGKAYPAETEYQYDENSDNMDGIIPIFNPYKIHNDKMYFTVIKMYEHSDEQNADMLTYIDISNGTKHSICPDPLCKHTYSGGCKYLGFFDPVFLNENIFYSVRLDLRKDAAMDINDVRFSIYKIETEKDIVEKIYSSENFYETILLTFIGNNKLYFFKVKSIKEEGEKSRKEVLEYFTLDLTTNKTEKIENTFSDDIYSSYFFSNDKYIYFRSTNDFFVTDLSLNNKKIVYSLKENENFSDFYYDRNTDEMYFGINNITDLYGYIYKTGDSFECEKLDMPNGNIYSFQLSGNNIYYTAYDPIIYGPSPFGSIMTIDETGEKIYKTDRKNPSDEIPVFDGKGEFYLGGGTMIAGDYLYIKYMQLMEEGVLSWFRSTDAVVRIHLYEKTIKWLNFD